MGSDPRHILMMSGGKDSTALAVYMRDRVAGMEYVFCDTDKELEETYEYLTKIEYALGNLATNNVYAWTDDDYKISRTLEGYFANFIKTGNPNGSNLPKWPAANSETMAPFCFR